MQLMFASTPFYFAIY
jgi:hypothetical protein